MAETADTMKHIWGRLSGPTNIELQASVPGGTPTKQEIRKQVWDFLEEHDLINAPKPPHKRIPNFKGAAHAGQKLPGLEEFRTANVLKVNPDKPQEEVRYQVLDHSKILLVPTPRLRSGLFNHMENPGGNTSKEYLRTLASRKGIDNHSRPLSMESKLHIDVVVIGAVAVDKLGHRIGKGEGFADLEFAMGVQLGMITADTVVVTTVHDCQVFDSLPEELFEDHDVPVDIIVTPTEVFHVENPLPKPVGVLWDKLAPEKLKNIPILKKIKFALEGGSPKSEKEKDEKSEKSEDGLNQEEDESRPRNNRNRNRNRRNKNRNANKNRSESPESNEQRCDENRDERERQYSEDDERQPKPREVRRYTRSRENGKERNDEREGGQRSNRNDRRDRRRNDSGDERRRRDSDYEDDERDSRRRDYDDDRDERRRRDDDGGRQRRNGDRRDNRRGGKDRRDQRRRDDDERDDGRQTRNDNRRNNRHRDDDYEDDEYTRDSRSSEKSPSSKKNIKPRKSNYSENQEEEDVVYDERPMLYVGKIPRRTRVTDLKLAMSERGVKAKQLVWKRGYAFLFFEETADAEEMFTKLSDLKIGEDPLDVQREKYQERSY